MIIYLLYLAFNISWFSCDLFKKTKVFSWHLATPQPEEFTKTEKYGGDSGGDGPQKSLDGGNVSIKKDKMWPLGTDILILYIAEILF